MQSFINRDEDLVYTEAQISKRLAQMEHLHFPIRKELVLNRLQWAATINIRELSEAEQAELVQFQTLMGTLEYIGGLIRADNAFVAEKVACKTAQTRLAQYRLADGREAQYAEQETGELDEFGEPVTEQVLVAEAVEPLPATIEQDVFNEAGEQTGTETVSNPLIVADDAERAAAQAIVDGTSGEVLVYLER